MKTIKERFFDKVRKTSTCWIWVAGRSTRYGYGVISNPLGRKYPPLYAHRLSYEIHKGEIPIGNVIMHTCDNAVCVNPNHLIAGTQASNLRDCANKKRHAFGEKNGNAKFTNKQIKFISLVAKRLCNKYGDQARLSKILNIDPRTLNDIIHKKSWALITQR